MYLYLHSVAGLREGRNEEGRTYRHSFCELGKIRFRPHSHSYCNNNNNNNNKGKYTPPIPSLSTHMYCVEDNSNSVVVWQGRMVHCNLYTPHSNSISTQTVHIYVMVLIENLLVAGISIPLIGSPVKNKHYLHSWHLASLLVYGTEGVVRIKRGVRDIRNQ